MEPTLNCLLAYHLRSQLITQEIGVSLSLAKARPEANFSIVVPFGRFMKMDRKDLGNATKCKAEGGTGIAEQFWEWNEKQIKPYL